MKVLVIDFAASEGGALEILKQYYDCALKDNHNEYFFLLSDNYVPEKKHIHIILLKNEKKWIKRLIFDHCTGKRIIKKIKPDKIISLQNTIIRGIDAPQILYVHQSIPFQNIKRFSIFKKDERKLAIIQFLIGKEIKASIKNASKIIVQTNWMKQSIVEKCNIRPSKIEVEKPKTVIKMPNKKLNKDNKIFFCPTSDLVYKNNQVIYDAVKKIKEDGYDNFAVEMTICGKSTKHIKKIGKISRNKVIEKYIKHGLLFPSYIETIGLPLLEARKCRADIIAARTVFSEEALSGYKKVHYFNFDDYIELANIMEKRLDNE